MERKDTLIKDFTRGNVMTQLLIFAGPLMLSNLLQIFYNMVDMAVVGRFIGSTGLTAVSSGGDIINIGTTICMGFGTAGQILISQQIGRKDFGSLHRTIGTLFSFMVLLALVITGAGILSLDILLNAINVPPEALGEARDYGIICCWGMLVIFGYNICSAVLRGMGDSKRPFTFITIASVMNLLLDLLFVALLGMGTRGAALATVISQAFSFIISLVYLFLKREAFAFGFRWRSFLIDGKILTGLVKLGLPITMQSFFVVFSKLFVNSYINFYGLVIATVNAIGTKIGFCASIVAKAMGNAGTSMIGQNFGAGEYDRIRKIVFSSMLYSLVFTLVLSLVIILYPEQVFGIFDKNPEVLKAAHSYVIIAVLNFNAFALRFSMMSLVHGVGNSLLAMVTGLVDGIFARILLAILLGVTFHMGIMGFWYGSVLASYIPFLIGGTYFWKGAWKRRKMAVEAA